jgi:hypothetical protein
MNLSTLISNLRVLANDGPTDHVVFSESIGTRNDGLTFDGANKIFRIGGEDGHTLPIVPGSVYLTCPNGLTPFGVGGFGQGQFDSGYFIRSQVGFTLDDPINGILLFTSAPKEGTKIVADYNYYWFTDTKLTEFLNEAAQMTLAGINDPTMIIDGMVHIMMQFALSLFMKARAAQYAERYRTSGGEAGTGVDAVTKAYMDIAKKAGADGEKYQTLYYQRQGQRNAPAAAIVTFRIDPITPRR